MNGRFLTRDEIAFLEDVARVLAQAPVEARGVDMWKRIPLDVAADWQRRFMEIAEAQP